MCKFSGKPAEPSANIDHSPRTCPVKPLLYRFNEHSSGCFPTRDGRLLYNRVLSLIVRDRSYPEGWGVSSMLEKLVPPEEQKNFQQSYDGALINLGQQSRFCLWTVLNWSNSMPLYKTF
jgi:hypothetical protein